MFQVWASAMAATVFILWLVISIINQFPGRKARWYKRLDVFAAIPIWTFFAPNPSMSDYHLLYRDRLVDGSLGVWKELRLESDSPLVRAIWNPRKRLSKALFDMVSSLLAIAPKMEPPMIKITVPYIALLGYVTRQEHSVLTQETQFMVFQTFGFTPKKEPTFVFVSEFHSI